MVPDCETCYLIGLVRTPQARWFATVEVCREGERPRLTEERGSWHQAMEDAALVINDIRGGIK